MPPVDAFSPVYLQFATVAGTWYATLFDYANQLFLMLATIESGLGAIQWMVAQQSHDYVAMGLFRKILWIGFMYAMLLNAHTWIPAVISSFVQAGREASGIRGLNPAEIFHSRGQKCRRADARESRSKPPETAERNRRGRMKTTIQHLRQFGQKALALGRYLHGDSLGKQPAHRYDTIAEQSGGSSRGPGMRRGPREFGTEPRDPLEITLLGGDRDEYIEKSFWHDAEAGGVTFDESCVDGVWDENAGEMWK